MTSFEHGYALLIGVDANAVAKWALPDVAKDIAALREVLVHPERCAYLADNVNVLTGKAATRQGILDGLEHIVCEPDMPHLPLSARFWPTYEAIKRHREHIPMPKSDLALEIKAENNLRSALQYHTADLEDEVDFIRTLLRDLKEYQTLSKYTLRRLTVVEMNGKVSARQLNRFRGELAGIRRALGEDYLERIAQRLQGFRSEVIIAVENVGEEGDRQPRLL